MHRPYYALACATTLIMSQTLSMDLVHSWGKKHSAIIVAVASYAGHRMYQYINQTAYRGQKKSPIDEEPYPATAPTLTLFAHGLGGSHKSGFFYKKHLCIPGHVQTFDFQDSHVHSHPKPANLAQDGDIQCLVQEYDKAVQSGNKVILYGVSRGASHHSYFYGHASYP